MTTRRRRGRPPRYSAAIAQEICDRLVCSEIGLARMLDEASDLPCSKTVWTWMAAMPECSQKVAVAKDHQLDRMQYLGVQLIDSVDVDAPNAPVALASAKASAEARFKLAAKIAPRRYGTQARDNDDADRRPIVLQFDAQDANA
jgi:hypothetical protein